MTSDQWIDMTCPKCKARNWVNNGDVEDLTVEDVGAVQCWSCRHQYRLGQTHPALLEFEPDPLVEIGRNNPDDSYPGFADSWRGDST